MEIDIANFKRIVNHLPDDGKILIHVEREYDDRINYSYEKLDGYRKVGKVLILECSTVV